MRPPPKVSRPLLSKVIMATTKIILGRTLHYTWDIIICLQNVHKHCYHLLQISGGVGVRSIPQPTAPQAPEDHTPSFTHLSSTKTAPTPSVPRSHTQSHTPFSAHYTLPQNKATSAHMYVSSTTKTPASSHLVAPHQMAGGGSQRKRNIPETPESKEMAKKRQELQRRTGELLQKQLGQQKVRESLMKWSEGENATFCSVDFRRCSFRNLKREANRCRQKRERK